MITAESCINKCYKEEVARESEQAHLENSMGSVFSLWNAVPFGGSIASGIGEATLTNVHTQINLAAQNCEQLSAVLITQNFKITSDEIKAHVDTAIAAVDQTNRNLAELHSFSKKMERSLLDALKNQGVLINVMRLETLMTEFLNCAGYVDHAHAAAQGLVSDLRSIKQEFKNILSASASEASSAAQKFLELSSSWEQTLPGRLDPIAIQALDGLRCMSTLASNSGIVELYKKEKVKILMQKKLNSEPWGDAFTMMQNIQSLWIGVLHMYVKDDEFLDLILLTISQTQFILRLAPREGYWEKFVSYSQGMHDALLPWVNEGALAFTKKQFTNILQQVASEKYPVPHGCLSYKERNLALWNSSYEVTTFRPSNHESLPLNNGEGVDDIHWAVSDLQYMVGWDSTSSRVQFDMNQGQFFGDCGFQRWSDKYFSGQWVQDPQRKPPIIVDYSDFSLPLFPKGIHADIIMNEQPVVCNLVAMRQQTLSMEEYHGCILTPARTVPSKLRE